MKKLLAWAGAVALALLPTIAVAQSGPPVSTRMANGSAKDSTPVYNFCSNDSGATWVACPGSGGGGGGDASAANQTTQITAAQLTNTTLGAVTTSPTANTVLDRLKTLHTDMVAATPAGTNVIGKVGIDQTTPGTTNFVWSLGSRPFTAKGGPIANGTSAYSSGQSIGGIVTISTGLPAGTIITAAAVRVKALLTTVTTAGAVNYQFFDANPTASTFTDGATAVLNSADLSKNISLAAVSWTVGTTTSADFLTFTVPRIAVDGSGNIYLAIIASAASQFNTSSTLLWQIDGTF